MRFDARGSLEHAEIEADHLADDVSMRFDARGSLEPDQLQDRVLESPYRFLCALTREAPWNDDTAT